MNKTVLFGALAFGVTLAVVVTQRLSDQAMAVIVGSVIGVAASVPMTAIVLWLMLRQRDSYLSGYAHYDHAPREETPRIMLIQPQAYPTAQAQVQALPYLQAPLQQPSYMRAPRDFKIVGQEDGVAEDRNALV